MSTRKQVGSGYSRALNTSPPSVPTDTQWEQEAILCREWPWYLSYLLCQPLEGRLVPSAALTVPPQAGKLITIRNGLAHDPGGWKSKIQGPASTEGLVMLPYPSGRAERDRESRRRRNLMLLTLGIQSRSQRFLKIPPTPTYLH